MASAGTAYIDVVPQMDTFGRDLDRGVTRTTSSLGSKITKFGAVAAAGFGAVAVGATAAFRAFEESQQVAAQTDAVIQSTGKSAGVTAEQVSNLASALSAKTAIDDEAIQSGENLLLTFTNIRNEAGKGNDVFNQATRTLLDLSVAMGTEPKQAAIQLGKALNDPIKGITALTRVGVTFTDQQKAQIEALVESGKTMEAQKIILAELNKEFGGSAEAQKTATAALGVAFGNLAEVVGGVLAPAFEFLADKIGVGIAFLQENVPPVIEALKAGFGDLLERIRPVATFIGEKLVAIFQALVAAMQEDIIPAFVGLWNAIKPAVGIVVKFTAALWVVILEVAPVLIRIIGKIIEVISGIVGAISNVIGAIVRFGQNVVEKVGVAWDFLKEVAAWIRDRFVSAWQRLGEIASSIWDGIKSAATTALNGIILLINGVVHAINALIRAYNALPFVGNIDTIDTIEPLARGGIVTRPTLSMVGERGPEAVIPLDRFGTGDGWGSGDIVIQIDGETVFRAVRNQALRTERNNGTAALGG